MKLFTRISPLFVMLTVLAFATFSPAQTVTTLYNFNGTVGANPYYMTLAQGQDGLLYGTTYNGGASNLGAAFKVDTLGNATLLHSFAGTADGENPAGGLTLGTDGNFYGTTVLGGTTQSGTIFKMTSSGTVTVLYNFLGTSDGSFPYAAPLLGSDGALYGTASVGGTGDGVVYKITTAGVYKVIYTYDNTHGSYPASTPLLGADGNLYITSILGGSNYCGSVIKLSTAGVLGSTYNFTCGTTGAYPVGSLIQGSDGNYYGTTEDGGAYSNGLLFKLSKAFAFSSIHSFGATTTEGLYPSAGVVQATDGNYYGVTTQGGTLNDGSIFESTSGNVFSTLFSFNNSANLMPAYPLGEMMQHTNGTLYGVTQFGGTSNFGTVFSLSRSLAKFCALVQYTGKAGNSIEILGQGFTGATKVTFNGLSAASFKIVSDTYLTTVAPTGVTSGNLVVTTPTGTLTSAKIFTVKH